MCYKCSKTSAVREDSRSVFQRKINQPYKNHQNGTENNHRQRSEGETPEDIRGVERDSLESPVV